MSTPDFETSLAQYAATLSRKGSKSASLDRTPMATFCDVTVHTVTRWMLSDMKPLGLPLVKARHYLHEKGYPVRELEKLKETAFRLSSLIGYGKISVEDATAILGYQDNKGVLRIAHGETTQFSPERLEKIRQLWDERSDGLPGAYVKPTGLLPIEAPVEHPEGTHGNLSYAPAADSSNRLLGSSSHSKVDRRAPKDKDPEIKTMAYMVLAMELFAKRMVSDEFTAEDRKTLRELTDNGVYALSNYLIQLCGEEARASFRKQSSGKF